MARANQRVQTLHREGKLGLGTAYITGFKWALERGYDYVFEMDADFSHDPAHLKEFLDRKSTRLNSSHSQISYAVFCLKKKKKRILLSVIDMLDSQLTGETVRLR